MNYAEKRKTLLDVQVMRLMEQFEQSCYEFIDNIIPRKFRGCLALQWCQALYEAKELMLRGLGLEIRLFAEKKYYLMNEAQCKLFLIQTIMNRLNDNNVMSDTAKAKFDIALDDIITNVSSVLNSLLRRIDVASQNSQSTESGETRIIEGCLTANDYE